MGCKWLMGSLLAVGLSLAGADLLNEDFSASKPGMDLPAGWRAYGRRGAENYLKVMQLNGKNVLQIVDWSEKETGLARDFPAKAGKFYKGTITLSPLGKTPPQDVIRLQIRFLGKGMKPSWVGGAVAVNGTTEFSGTAPAGTTSIRVFIYTSFAARMDVALHSFKLEELDKAPVINGNPKRGFVPPVETLKDMCLETPLDKVSILADPRYAADAARLADAIARNTGRRPAILPDNAKAAGHKILLGNRDTNQTIEMLYRRHFAFTDITYPGKGGYELRTVHNPFGDKVNFILVGGSDDAGVAAATDRLIAKGGKSLAPTIDVRIYPELPKDIKSTQYATRMGGNFPGYGWNTLVWLLEMYYRSGDAKYAREFIRLGLHTKPSDMPRLKEVNAESFWDFSQPLSTPYHYMGHYLVLLWDMVEEQSVFSDAERLAVTRALAKQIKHPDINMCYNPGIDKAPPAGIVGDRHAQWSVMMMYVLARYMQRDYPHPVWETVLKCAEHFHEPIFRPGTWGAASSTFSWFASSMLNEPAQYLLLAGKGAPHPDGMLMNAVRVYEIMWGPGRSADANGTMSAHNHRLLAALTGDRKFHYYADQLEVESATMKLGQSFRSAKDQSRVPEENIGQWIVAPLPDAACRRRGLPEPFKGYTLNTGYRDSLDNSGDRIMFDLFNELGRRPYQLNVLYYLRIAGKTYLAGYENYLQVVRNGIASSLVPTVGILRKTGAVENCAYHVSDVPDMAHGVWERALLLKKRKAVLLADRITAKADGPLQVILNWSIPQAGAVRSHENTLSFMNSHSISAADMVLKADGPIRNASNARVASLKKAGDTFQATFTLSAAFKGDILVRLVSTVSSPRSVAIALNGKVMHRNIPLENSGADTVTPVRLDGLELPAGKHTLSITVAQPGVVKNDIQLWRLNFAAKGAASCIAGAGMEAGRTFHKGSAPELKAGQSHTFFTVCGDGATAARVEGHPNAAILHIPEKTVAFSGEFKPFGKGRVVWADEKETIVMEDDYRVTVRPTTAEAARALKDLKAVPYAAFAKPEKVPEHQPRIEWPSRMRLPRAEAVMFKGKPALFLGGNGRAAVIGPDGKTLLTLTFPGRLLSLHGTGKLLLIGTLEDHVFAFDENGKRVWTHRSICATPFEKQKHYYWYKGACPGVAVLSSMDGDIYTGGACTVERLSADGKVIKRYEQLWGTVAELLPLVRKDGSRLMLSSRPRHGSNADVFAVDPVSNTSRVMLRGAKKGFRDFPSFASMIRNRMLSCDVNGDGQQEIVTTSNGMYTWIQIFDEQGKILHQVNLGGKPQLSDLAAGRDLVAAVDPMRRLLIFDGQLNIKVLRDLPRVASQVMVEKDIFVLDPNGVAVYDRTGKLLRRMVVDNAHRMVRLADGTLCVIGQNGEVCIF